MTHLGCSHLPKGVGDLYIRLALRMRALERYQTIVNPNKIMVPNLNIDESKLNGTIKWLEIVVRESCVKTLLSRDNGTNMCPFFAAK